ncbi:MAG TPA: NADH-quinone oxidoreductase subunit C [Acidimicrobiales bacterium]|nr:NADH-quinone oxidoreductase subunit C [Acidimicrobiales bacterium]
MTDATTTEATDAPTDAPPPEPELLHGSPVITDARGQRIVFASREQYRALMEALAGDGFNFCADLCGVDYLTHPGRALPAGVEAERFEIVVNLVSMDHRVRVRVRVQVPESDPTVATLFEVWPGTEAMEREVWDMFGVAFDGHPDLTRILMPEDWEGHPLRKDYAIGRVPVQFKATTVRPEAQS